MCKLLVFSDTHICDFGKTIAGLDPFAKFDCALKHALLHHSDADFIIHLGDLTHSGKAVEYKRAAQILKRSPITPILLPGNHDQRELLLEHFPATALCAGGFMQSAMRVNQDNLILTLDTLNGPPYRRGSYAGWLCSTRLNWLAEQLKTAGDAHINIFMHHPPFDVGFPGMDAISLQNRDAFFTVLRSVDNPIHLFCGHIHRTISGTANGYGFSVFKSTCHQAPLMLGIDDVTGSVDEPAAYGVVLLNKNGCIVHSEDFEVSQPYQGAEADALPDGA